MQFFHTLEAQAATIYDADCIHLQRFDKIGGFRIFGPVKSQPHRPVMSRGHAYQMTFAPQMHRWHELCQCEYHDN
jgi:hypothetical protein